jgi:hypothetical protein
MKLGISIDFEVILFEKTIKNFFSLVKKNQRRFQKTPGIRDKIFLIA